MEPSWQRVSTSTISSHEARAKLEVIKEGDCSGYLVQLLGIMAAILK